MIPNGSELYDRTESYTTSPFPNRPEGLFSMHSNDDRLNIFPTGNVKMCSLREIFARSELTNDFFRSIAVGELRLLRWT